MPTTGDDSEDAAVAAERLAAAGSTPEQLAAVRLALTGVLTEIRTENRLRKKQIRRRTIWSIFAAFLGVVGIVVGTRGLALASDAHDAVTRATAAQAAAAEATAEARLNVCLQSNLGQVGARAAQKAHDRQWADFLSPQPRSRERQKLIDDDLALVDKLTDRSFPLRDCTPAGIRKFYETPPAKKIVKP